MSTNRQRPSHPDRSTQRRSSSPAAITRGTVGAAVASPTPAARAPCYRVAHCAALRGRRRRAALRALRDAANSARTVAHDDVLDIDRALPVGPGTGEACSLVARGLSRASRLAVSRAKLDRCVRHNLKVQVPGDIPPLHGTDSASGTELAVRDLAPTGCVSLALAAPQL